MSSSVVKKKPQNPRNINTIFGEFNRFQKVLIMLMTYISLFNYISASSLPSLSPNNVTTSSISFPPPLPSLLNTSIKSSSLNRLPPPLHITLNTTDDGNTISYNLSQTEFLKTIKDDVERIKEIKFLNTEPESFLEGFFKPNNAKHDKEKEDTIYKMKKTINDLIEANIKNITNYGSNQTFLADLKGMLENVQNLDIEKCGSSSSNLLKCYENILTDFYNRTVTDDDIRHGLLALFYIVLFVSYIFLSYRFDLKEARREAPNNAYRRDYNYDGRIQRKITLSSILFSAIILGPLWITLENMANALIFITPGVLNIFTKQNRVHPSSQIEEILGGKKQDYTKTTEKYGSRCVYLSKRKGKYLKVDGKFIPYKSAVKMLDKKKKTSKSNK